MKNRLILLFFIITSCVFALPSCAFHNTPSPSYFSYRNDNLRAQINGTCNGLSFCAVILRTKLETSVSYLAPAALEGVTLKKSAQGVTVSIDGTENSVDGTALTGLLSPLEALFENSEILRIQKQKGGTELFLSGESVLTLGENGTPISFRSPALCFDVVWWESDPDGS